MNFLYENIESKLLNFLSNVNKNLLCTHYGPANRNLERVFEHVSLGKTNAHGKIKVQIINTKQRKTDLESYLSYIAAN